MRGHGLSDALSTKFFPHAVILRVEWSLFVGQGDHHCSLLWNPLWGCRLVGKGAVSPVLGLARSCAPWQGRALGTIMSQTAVEAGPPLTPLSLWLQSESPKDAASAPPKAEPPKAEPPKPEPVKSPEPAKSPEPPPGRGKSPEPVLNGAAENGLEGAAAEAQGDDGQGLSRRKVVRVVRKVVRKVLPGEDAGSAKEPGRDAKSPEPVPPPRKEEAGRTAVPAPPAPPPPPTVVPSAPSKPEPKDEISEGLKTLMAKGKTKEHRARLRPGDRQEKSREPAGGDTKLSPSPEAKAEPPVQLSGGKAEPAKASALKPTALERHKVPVCARRGML
ncbi:diacylglycerol kinase kappa-like [Serinus canaria]|uniref:diacylglycerol kinase kappa-like n=1 Tax=Serinus canaria TaxID=9135 RepID=UPI0021CC728D|nr:diacylglycerol kinase kappa-like [Serinus canaria]